MQAHQGQYGHPDCRVEWSVGQGQRQGVHPKVIRDISPEMMSLGAVGSDGSGEKGSDPGYV